MLLIDHAEFAAPPRRRELQDHTDQVHICPLKYLHQEVGIEVCKVVPPLAVSEKVLIFQQFSNVLSN